MNSLSKGIEPALINDTHPSGVLLDTPVPQRLDPRLATDLLSGADMLILTFEQSPAASSRGGLKTFLADWLAGAPVSAQRELQNLDLRSFAAQTVVVPLRTEHGDFTGALNGTLNFTMSLEIRNHLQEQLEQAVLMHLARRAGRDADAGVAQHGARPARAAGSCN